jgi:hypothetical protein
LIEDIKSALYDAKEAVEVSNDLEDVLLSVQDRYAPLGCAAFEALITEFLDGFVPALTYHRFEAHANDCTNCSDLLTEVVYAVAACHSVHTYEDLQIPESLNEKLFAAMPVRVKSLREKLASHIASFAGAVMPRRTHGKAWTFATTSGLAFAMFLLLLFGFSDDRTVSGIFRQAQVRISNLYSRSTDIYAQKEEVIAGLHRVRSDIGDVWNTLGGESEGESAQKK